MEILIAIVSLLLGAFAIFARQVALNRGAKSRVPPGKLSFPFLGETFSLFRSGYFKFIEDHQKRFGEVFSSNIFGNPTIFATTTDAAKFFLLSPAAKKCAASQLTSLTNIVGDDQVNQVDGTMHTLYRRIILAAMLPDALKHQVEWIDRLAVKALSAWEQQDLVNTHQEAIKFAYDVITGFICERLRPSTPEAMRVKQDVAMAIAGVMSVPINLPFITSYSKALQARKRIHIYLDKLISERRCADGEYTDLLQSLLNHRNEDGSILSNKQIEDNVMVSILAGHHTIAQAIVWLMKHLHDNPTVLETVKQEQMEIAATKGSKNEPLRWEDTRKMTITLQALHESLRLANVVRIFTRRITEDIEYKGYVYPKGWNLAFIPASIHMSGENFANPDQFDLHRHKTPPKLGTFLPFGLGNRLCVGMELARLEILIFFHRLLTQYSYEPVNPGIGVKHWPMRVPKDGYLIRTKRLAS